MKRRALLAALFSLAGTVAIADPTHAWERRRVRRIRRAYRYRPVSYSTNSSNPISQQSRRRVEQPSIETDYSDTRSADGTLTEEQVYRFREKYADGQSRQAMRSALGEPSAQYWDRDVWRIKRNGLDGKPSGEFGTFEASYEWGKGGWDGPTKTPPKANW